MAIVRSLINICTGTHKNGKLQLSTLGSDYSDVCTYKMVNCSLVLWKLDYSDEWDLMRMVEVLWHYGLMFYYSDEWDLMRMVEVCWHYGLMFFGSA